MVTSEADVVVLGYYLVCYNYMMYLNVKMFVVVPGYYLVCYNHGTTYTSAELVVVPGYYLVCYNLKIVMNLMAQL